MNLIKYDTILLLYIIIDFSYIIILINKIMKKTFDDN